MGSQDSKERTSVKAEAPPPREPDAIFQDGRLVARVIDAQVDLQARQVKFAEVYNSDELLLPEECEFQKYRIQIQHVADATKVSRTEPQKGRILRGVTADLLGDQEK
ncbi:MAG: hypothetical protein LAN62_17210 [Acidobacteriia bacterium]|nr:hypothetical protein [Terriglobia bacterium]